MRRSEEKLAEFTRRLHEAAGDNLDSIVLYGSAARGDFHELRSDLNLLCVLRSAKAADLARLARVIHWWSGDQKEPPPQFFTPDELRHSADVFSIELLDIGQYHKVLFGSDPVAPLSVLVDKSLVQAEVVGDDTRYRLLESTRHYAGDSSQPSVRRKRQRREAVGRVLRGLP